MVAPTPIQAQRKGKRAAVKAAEEREAQKRKAKELAQFGKKYALVKPENLAPTGSYSIPDFVVRGYYIDMPFTCKSCGTAQVWSGTQQKWWYESAKGDVWTTAIMCKPCRARERARKVAAREVHLAGLARKGKNAA